MPHDPSDESGTIEIATLEQYFTDSEDESREARERSETSRDFYDNIQLTAAQKTKLGARNQPAVVFNLVAPKVDFLLGTERQSRTDPKAFPRTPKHDDAADAVTDAIRFVLDKEDFDVKASAVFENMLIEGTGGCSVEAEAKDDGSIDIVLRYIRWDRWFADPFSLARDYSDSRYDGIVIWKDLVDAKARWPNAAESLQEGMTFALTLANDTYDDKPNDQRFRWFDTNRQRVMCIDIYYIWKQKWHHAIFAKGIWLSKPEVSPYLDEDGLPTNPHNVTSAKVKREGQRYGPVESLIDIQKEINSRRSKSLHIFTAKQTFSKEGQIVDINDFKKEANKSDGHMEFPNSGEFGKDFGVIPQGAEGQQHFAMYEDAKLMMDTAQANAALAGKTEGALSGRAIQSLQQGGLIELTPLFDSHSQWKKSIYRAVWDRIRQFWREDKWIRVTDDEDNLKFVGLNQPISIAEQRIAEQTGLSVKEVRDEFEDEIAQIHQQQPETAEIAEIENEVAEIDVDIIIEEVPDVVNLQSEQFELLVKMFQANPDGIPWEEIVKMSSLRNKDKILKKELEPEERQAIEQQQQEQAEITEIAKGKEVAEIEKTRAQTGKTLAETDKITADTGKTVVDARKSQAETVKIVEETEVIRTSKIETRVNNQNQLLQIANNR